MSTRIVFLKIIISLTSYLICTKTYAKDKETWVLKTSVCYSNIASLKEDKHIQRVSENFIMTCEETIKNADCAILIENKKVPDIIKFTKKKVGSIRIYAANESMEIIKINKKQKRFYHSSMF